MHASSRAVPSLHPSQSPNDSNDCSLSAPRSPSLVGCGRAEHAFWALLMMAEEPVHIVTVFRDLLGSSGPFLFSVSRLLQQVSSTPPEILRYSLVRLPACALYRPEHARGARDHSWRSSDLHLRPVGTSLPLAPVCADSQYAHCELAQRAQTCLKQGQPGSRGSAGPLEACGVDYLFGIFDRQVRSSSPLHTPCKPRPATPATQPDRADRPT